MRIAHVNSNGSLEVITEKIRFGQKHPIKEGIEVGRSVFLARLASEVQLILDCGCGEGSIANAIGKTHRNVIGIDMSIEMAKLSKDKGIEVVLGTASRLPFRNEIFDTVIMSHILEHVILPEEVISETHRVTKKRGRLVIATPNVASLKNRVFLIFGKFPEEYVREHIHHFTLSKLRHILTSSSFRAERKFGYFFILESILPKVVNWKVGSVLSTPSDEIIYLCKKN